MATLANSEQQQGASHQRIINNVVLERSSLCKAGGEERKVWEKEDDKNSEEAESNFN